MTLPFYTDDDGNFVLVVDGDVGCTLTIIRSTKKDLQARWVGYKTQKPMSDRCASCEKLPDCSAVRLGYMQDLIDAFDSGEIDMVASTKWSLDQEKDFASDHGLLMSEHTGHEYELELFTAGRVINSGHFSGECCSCCPDAKRCRGVPVRIDYDIEKKRVTFVRAKSASGCLQELLDTLVPKPPPSSHGPN